MKKNNKKSVFFELKLEDYAIIKKCMEERAKDNVGKVSLRGYFVFLAKRDFKQLFEKDADIND